MSRKDFTIQSNVKVEDLLLDRGNPRIRSAIDQSDCIARVLHKREQMLNMMKSLAKEGLSTVPILVAPCTEVAGKWIVKDGNRRITALKLLNNPSLCADEELQTQIKNIVKDSKDGIDSAIDCLSSNDPVAIAREVKLRHSGALAGVGQLDWSAYLRTVYELNNALSTDYKRAGQYLLWAEDKGIAVADEFPISTVHRFFTIENIGTLGFIVENDELALNTTQAIALAMANEVIGDLSSGRKKVDDLFTGDAAKVYLTQLRKNAGWPFQNEPTKPTSTTPPSAETNNTSTSTNASSPASSTSNSPTPSPSPAPTATPSPSTRGGRPPSKPNWDRKKLFWLGAPQPALSVSTSEIAGKMRAIFYEVAQIKDVRESPLTTAFLIRAIIELSEKEYRTTKSLTDKKKLADNIFSACDSMLGGALMTGSQVDLVKAYTATTRSDVGIFNVDTLQKYLHRETHKPAPQTINTFWDELYPFVHACWK